MKTCIAFLSLALVAASPALAEDEIPAELKESLREEIVGIADSIRVLGPIADQLSPDMEEQYDEAKRLAGEARDLAKKERYRMAYRTLRQAKHAVTPVVASTLSAGTASAEVKQIVTDEVAMVARRVEIVAGLLSDRSPAEAKDAYREAKDLYQQAKALHAEGKDADAIRTLDECLTKLDVAIKSTFGKEN